MQPTTDEKSNRRSAILRPDGPAGGFIAASVLLALGSTSLALVGQGLDWAMPRVLTYLALGFGVAIAVHAGVALRTGARASAPAGSTSTQRAPGRAQDLALFVAAAILFVLGVGAVGFWLSSLVMFTAVSIYLSNRRDLRTILRSVGIALAVCALGYTLFTHVLYVPVPTNAALSAMLRAVGL